MAHRFIQYEFRTPDVAGAQAFYSAVLGVEHFSGNVTVSQLSEQALARGARPHWLGHIGVSELEASAQRFLAEGGQQLGPALRDAEGRAVMVLRDPLGAMVALHDSDALPAQERVALHVMHSADEVRAFALYASLFHWEAREVIDLSPGMRLQTFGWDGSGRNAGSISNMAGQQGIHPQWLYFFPVADIDAAIARVRANGGLALPTVRTEKSLLAGCDDAQGAAFGLYQALG